MGVRARGLGSGGWVLGLGLRAWGQRSGVRGTDLRTRGDPLGIVRLPTPPTLLIRDKGLGIRVWGLRIRVEGLRLRVETSGLMG